MCFGAIYWARLGKVYYVNTAQDAADIGFDDSHIYEEIAKSDERRKISFERLTDFKDDGLDVFKMWSAAADDESKY